MRSLVLILALALVACTGKPSSTTPKLAVPHGPVTADALTAYFSAALPKAVADKVLVLDFGSGGVADEVIKELAIMGADDMSEVAALLPADFATKGIPAIQASEAPSTTVAGLLRDLMIMKDTRGYFTKAWNNGWVTSGPQDFPAPAVYGVDFGIMRELGVFGGDDGGEGNPCGGGDEDMGDEDPCS